MAVEERRRGRREEKVIDRRLAAGIRWSFLGLAFFLPLLVSTRSSEVFELPKMLFVYAAAAVITGLWLGRMVIRRQILIRRTPLDIPILLFLISQMASTIYSIDPHVSWWGWYGRWHGGLWSTISYTLLYYAMVSNFSGTYGGLFSRTVKQYNGKTVIGKSVTGSPVSRFTELPAYRSTDYRSTVSPFHRLLVKTILASAAIVSIYAVLQHFGIDKDFWVQDVVNRVFSTQGQPNWLAGYIVMILPVGWMLTIADFKMVSEKRKLIAILLYCYIAILFLALLWTKSRSGLLGLAVADGVFWLAMLVKLKVKSEKLKVARRFVLIHALMAGLILATNNPAREWVLNRRQATSIPAMESGITLRKSEHGGTESGDIRAVVWSGAVQLVKQRPISGFGPETFGETYWRVRPKGHNLTSEWNFLYNKAHNEWLNLAANTGILGLGSHLLLLIWFSVWAMRRFATANLPLSAAIWAAIVGVEAVNFFGFSTVTVGAYRYLFMAMAVSSSLRGASATKQSRRDCHAPPLVGLAMTGNFREYPSRSILQGVSLAVVAVAVFYILSQLFILFLADLAYNRGRAYQDGGYIQESIEPLIQAVNLVPAEPVFRAELGEAEGILAASLSQRDPSASPQDDVEPLKEAALVNFEIVRKQSPQNLGFIRTQARILFLLGEQDKALQLMKAAMELAPTNPQLPYSLGIMLDKLGKTDESPLYYNKALELKPDYPAALEKL